ncbi:DUF5131 family protein [Akkermansia sp.]|uniref:DUF5131 family protein n=1 Tax=Akkermansia sp. TaxID=1872421 RepID=UPI0031F2E509
MAMWNPWRGCHRYSDGCKFCYIHQADRRRGMNTDEIVKTDTFYAPVLKNKKGDYRMKPGQTVYLGFSTDFLIREADPWRGECWDMIRKRPDLNFIFLTKRIERFMECVPGDWGDGYDNVTAGCTVENQDRADFRLPIFNRLPIKHKNIICQPLLEQVDLTPYLHQIELVVVGGESNRYARPLDYAWVLSIREQCIRSRVRFEFRQCGTNFLKDGKMYHLHVRLLCSQAKKAGINC